MTRNSGATVCVKFAKPHDVITLNRRLSWWEQNKAKKAWRDTAHYAALAYRTHPSGRRTPALAGRWFCWVSYPVSSLKTRRDPHNWTLTDKWIIDGLVSSGLLEDDDASRLVHLDATFHRYTDMPMVCVNLSQGMP